MKVAVVGATGMVGAEMLKVLEECNFPVTELIPVATERSAGKELVFKGNSYKITGMGDAVSQKPALALFSAGGKTSLEFAPEFAAAGTTVIDNSSAWRMNPAVKLIVPGINETILTAADKIISNPNCSTIQLLIPLAPLHLKYHIRRLVVSTYQSVTGTGKRALVQLEDERSGKNPSMVYPWPIHNNCLPHCDQFLDNGYTREEMKIVEETHKILDRSIAVTATAVRVPVTGGHSESVNIEFDEEFQIEEVLSVLGATPGVLVMDDPERNIYPMPLLSSGKNEVMVGRIRRDYSQSKTLNMWIVADNLRVGAATNAVRIALYLSEKGLL